MFDPDNDTTICMLHMFLQRTGSVLKRPNVQLQGRLTSSSPPLPPSSASRRLQRLVLFSLLQKNGSKKGGSNVHHSPRKDLLNTALSRVVRMFYHLCKKGPASANLIESRCISTQNNSTTTVARPISHFHRLRYTNCP